jgi:hypothetical protein
MIFVVNYIIHSTTCEQAYSDARNSGFSDYASPQVRCTAEYMPGFRYILHLTLSKGKAQQENTVMSDMSETNERTVIAEIKYITTNNTAMHTENYKLEISLQCTARELAKTIRLKTGIEDCCKKKGFADRSGPK